MTGDVFEAVTAVLARQDPAHRAQPDAAMRAWEELADLGFPWVCLPEELGGSGGEGDDILQVLSAVGLHGSSVPLADSGFVAGWLLTSAGLSLEPRLLALADPTAGRLTYDGQLVQGTTRAAWAVEAGRLVALAEGPTGPTVVELDLGSCTVDEPLQTLAGHPTSLISIVGVEPLRAAVSPVDRDALVRRSAAVRVVLSAGALEGVQRLTVRYTTDRVQFGKPVRTFQAVQVHLARIAEEVALANLSAAAVAQAWTTGGDEDFVVAASTCSVRAGVTAATAAAHQAHGAMGVTREYPLHTLTRHLWQWSHEAGDRDSWEQRVWSHVRRGGADGLYPLLSSSADPVGSR